MINCLFLNEESKDEFKEKKIIENEEEEDDDPFPSFESEVKEESSTDLK